MPASGRPWNRTVAALKAESAAANAPCWICREPIDYRLTGRQSRAFSADHVTPTSLGGDALRRANLRPAHYQRMQQRPRQHFPRAISNLSEVVRNVPSALGQRGGGCTMSCIKVDLLGGDPSLREARTVGPAPAAGQDWSGSD